MPTCWCTHTIQAWKTVGWGPNCEVKAGRSLNNRDTVCRQCGRVYNFAELPRAFNNTVYSEWGLTVSVLKTKAMAMCSHLETSDTLPLQLSERSIKVVHNFTYLGSI